MARGVSGMAWRRYLQERTHKASAAGVVGGLTGFGTNMNVQQFGGHLDIGYRFQWNPWFFEPQGTIEVVHTEFCGSTAINCFNGGAVNFANTVVSLNDTSVRGRLGARVGLTGWQWAGWTVEPSVTGSVW